MLENNDLDLNEQKKIPPFQPSKGWISRALDIPCDLKDGQFKRFVEELKETFDAFDADGEINYNKLVKNLAYYMGHIYTNINVKVACEEAKCIEMTSELNKLRAVTLNELKMTKLKYDIDAKGLTILIEGNPEYSAMQMRVNKQKAFIDFLKRTLDQVGYYGNNSRIIIDKAKHEQQFGIL